MNLKKPKFWDQKPGLLTFLLLPFTIPIILNNILKNLLPPKKNKKIKSICIGNIYVGGTGKTPFTIKLYEILKRIDFKVCVGKKYYLNQKDELSLLDKKVRLFTDKKRLNIIQKAINDNNEVIIFDDGLQEKSINFDIKIVCFDSNCWIGNGFLIPSGPLREGIKSLKKFDGVLLKETKNNKNIKNIHTEIKKINPNITIFESEYKPVNINHFDLSKKYLIFSGIGNHNSFKNTLQKNNFNIIEELIFPDHFEFDQQKINEIIDKGKNLGTEIITTEKDFMKVSKFNCGNIKFLEIDLILLNEKILIDFFKQKINE